jgi:hypothetical protein
MKWTNNNSNNDNNFNNNNDTHQKVYSHIHTGHPFYHKVSDITRSWSIKNMWGGAKQNHILLVTHIIIILDTVSFK